MVETSIIIAARNEEEHISQCIESLLQQTYKDFEILIIDGKSTDNTKKIAKKYADKHARIRVFDNPQQRPAQARNIGFSKAKGKYVGYIDAHTTASKTWLQTLVHTIQKHPTWKGKPVGGVGSVHKNPNKEAFTQSITEAFQHPLGGGGSSYRITGKIRAVDTAYGCLYRKETLETIAIRKGVYYDKYFVKGQDADLNWRINKAGYTLLRDAKAITYYYKRNTWNAFRRQLIVYGFWRAKLTKKHHDLFKPTLFAPLAFYGMILSLILLSFFFNTLTSANIALALITSYVLAIILSSLHSQRPLEVSTMIVAIHFFYTIGLVKGFLVEKNTTKDRV